MTQVVRARFPDREAEILAVYLRSQEFRGLCHDFGVCIEEIEQLYKLRDSNDVASESAAQRLEQFQELERELETEIVEQLDSALTRHDQVSPQRKEQHGRTQSEPS